MHEKWDAHRRLCEVNSGNFKIILAEQMTEELRLTDEQVSAIERIFSQSIVGVQEFNEGLLKGIMEPMLAGLDEQNGILLEKESLLLEMVSQFFISIESVSERLIEKKGW